MLTAIDNVRFLLRGRWAEDAVRVTNAPSSRQVIPEVEAAIHTAWIETNARPGVSLFDGPVCRLESWAVTSGQLELAVSQTTYRVNVGTNFSHPEFAARFGREVMANPVGVSAGVITSDGYLIMGRRNGTVAYYPHMLHPFAGSLEVRADINLFDDVRRELREEVHLSENELLHMECIGVVEDQKLLHPETIFLVRANCSAKELQQRVNHEEHGSSQVVLATPPSLRSFAKGEYLTPVGAALCVRLAEVFDEDAAS